ncbi:L(+)-tartrate dehydratase beta subunit [Murinocardiopsis flavida]|uniref:L(+)-tartrate dehydratase beta subunit n=1 Tax=Murinocardiopsis flavida TaxID=645275 RepID=A0A2P8DTW4_9ACTN|nr:fumarate hydratase C-terminal domain-containing protein [Murinocardiopsis flavida]PSL00632.1 L(+)-tartrate dehydratase beta subunit [Murinocardiopsis flavida]
MGTDAANGAGDGTATSEGGGRVLHATTPLDEAFVRSLRCGDEVWLDGTVWGVRDASLIRFFDEGKRVDADFGGAVFLHTAPSVRPDGSGGYLPVSVGTTTSMRMDRFTRGCLDELGVRAIVGKGGLSAESLEHLRRSGGVYLAVTGGAASVQTRQVAEIEDVLWEDLMPECLWRFRMRGFGPLFVGMDSHGVSEYQRVRDTAQERRAAARRVLGL